MAAHSEKKIPGPKGFTEVDSRKLIALRGQKGLTRKALSAITGINRRTIASIEEGSAKSTGAKTIESLCEALDCRPADITRKYFYEDPAPGRSAVLVKLRNNKPIAPEILKIGRKYLVDSERLVLEAEMPGNNVVHYLFRQPTGNWTTTYTNIDFFIVGDVPIRPL